MDASASMIVRHWRGLDGAVHLEDRPIFERSEHTFNLDFPPPAYLGDIVNAPFVLLMKNGGYKPTETPEEFADSGAVERYLDHLHNPKPIQPGLVAPYYATANYARHIADGRLALVNAIAYRSVKLTEEPWNVALAEQLPSTQVHRRWLWEELIPQAVSGDRVVIAHRNGSWKLRRSDAPGRNVIFTPSAVSKNLTGDVIAALDGSTVGSPT
jgi:hypothetical protein